MKQVLSTEKKRVLNTKDYSLFNVNHVFSISKKHLNKIKDSISDKNLCPDYPILVNDEYDILEGKYRFLACYELNLPIYYKISEVALLSDAVKLKHITKKTPYNEIIEAYKDIPAYGNIISIFKEYEDKISYKDIVKTIQWGNRDYVNDFYSGKLNEWDFELTKIKVNRVLFMMDYFSCINNLHYACVLKACVQYFGLLESDNSLTSNEMIFYRKYLSYRQKSTRNMYQQIWSLVDTFKRLISELNNSEKVIYRDKYEDYLGIGIKPKKAVFDDENFKSAFTEYKSDLGEFWDWMHSKFPNEDERLKYIDDMQYKYIENHNPEMNFYK